jgi:biopolymer transport protein ExbB
MKRLTVQRLLAMSLLLAGLLAAPFAQANWNADWTKRAKIGLNTAADGLPLQTAVDAVPVLVRLHTGNFQFVDAKPDGSDLRFIAADDKTPLKFHVEKFDGLNELALIWVQVPKLTSGNKADFIWMYYGNANAAAASDSRTSYDANQALVYHFGEKEVLPQDSTANANHAQRSSAKPGGAGLIGGSASFDGSASVDLPASPSLDGSATGYTLSVWLKPQELADASLLRQDGGLHLLLRKGVPSAEVGALSIGASAPLVVGEWAHVAVVASDGLTLYVNGVEAGKLVGSLGKLSGAAVLGEGYKGEMDELEIASTARSADWIKLAAQSQGPQQKMVNYAPAEAGEEAGGASTLRILLGAVTIDGWVVIGILMVMFVISVLVMVGKTMFVAAASRDNDQFKQQFDQFVEALRPGGGNNYGADRATAARFSNSSLYRLYIAGAEELRNRFEAYAIAGRRMVLTDQSIAAIRASIDARMVRENQRLNSRMVLLTIAIAGGPFLGLLGTVVGVMITFAAIAAAGDVNVNAIAPGIAAALVATVAGLAVAIPALFGYNYLNSRIAELNADMQVFVDEFITRIAENHSV